MLARMLKLHHNTAKQLVKLKKDAEKDGEYRVARRIHAVLLNNSGNTSGSIAKILDSPRSRVAEWLKIYEEGGYENLLEGYRSGRPEELSVKQKQELDGIIESGPIAYGYLSGVWTSIMIAEVISREFSISYHPGHVRKILYGMNFSLQRPKRILAKADINKQNKWRRYTYPNIKKKPEIAAA